MFYFISHTVSGSLFLCIIVDRAPSWILNVGLLTVINTQRVKTVE